MSASTIRDLEGLPEPSRSAWLLGKWDVFVGQFFLEWEQAVHVCQPFRLPQAWRRFGMLDYGYAQPPLGYLQAAVSPDRRTFVYREVSRLLMVNEAQAEEIVRVCRDDPPEYIVAEPDLWAQSGKGQRGQSTTETYTRVFERLGSSRACDRATTTAHSGGAGCASTSPRILLLTAAGRQRSFRWSAAPAPSWCGRFRA